MEEIAVKEESTQNGEHAVSEVNLNAEEEDDDDDIFKSVRLEPQPNKVAEESNGLSREVSLEPDTDIPLEDDEHPFENAHLKPGLQLSEPELEPATLQPQTLTSFHEVLNRFYYYYFNFYDRKKLRESWKMAMNLLKLK